MSTANESCRKRFGRIAHVKQGPGRPATRSEDRVPKKILVVEDEESIRRIIRAFLEEAGYSVEMAGDGVEGVAKFRSFHPDLVLLDVMLPKADGFAVCEIIRSESDAPIIMLTALDDDASQMKGFDALADDYVTKPFSMPLVIKRIEAVLRRAESSKTGDGAGEGILRWRGVVLDPKGFSVSVDGSPLELTAKEFEILKALLENPGRVFTRQNLLERAWGEGWFGDERIVNTHVKNIRRKLGVDCIETVRGVGYRVAKENL